jgi:23S rRNA-/tRNA-specific pseudouridylate synthase
MRLDICTSGLLLFNRSPESAKRFTTATQAVKQVQQLCALPSFIQVARHAKPCLKMRVRPQ